MQNKLLPFAFIFITAVILVGYFVLFSSDDTTETLEGGGAFEEAAADDGGIEVNALAGVGVTGERVAIAGGEEVDEPDAMPESYRKALGGLVGRVVETDGTPVVDIRVEIFEASVLDIFQDMSIVMMDEPPPFELRTDKTRTGEDGTFRFTGIYPRGYQAIGVDLGGDRPTSRLIDSVPGPGETVDLGDIVLSPCAILTGRVLDDYDAPVSGARVRATSLPPVIFISGMQDYRDHCSFLVRFGSDHDVIEPPPMMKQFWHLLPFPTTTTAEDGTFRLDGVQFGPVTMVVDKPGFVTTKKSTIAPARGGERSVGDLYIDHGALLKGKVKDALGEPATGIEVRVGPIHGVSEFVVLQAPVVTDAEGDFEFEGAAPLPFLAAARRYPQDPWVVVGPFDPELEPPTLTLPPAYDLRVKVFRDDGSLAAGARLKFRQYKEYMNFVPINPPVTPGGRMVRPEPGVFDIQGLAPGTYDIIVAAKGYGVVKETVDIKAEAAVKDIVLEPAHTASVRVLTEKGKLPVEWATVHASPGEDAWWFNPTKLSRSKTDASGLAVFDNLAAGEYLVSASHPQYAVTDTQLVVPSDSETVILLKPGGILEGVVHQGGSTHGAPYMLTVTPDGRRGGDKTSPEAMTPRVTATDHEGNFRVTNLNPGEWDVHVMKRVLDQEPLGLTEVMRLGPLMSTEVQVWSGETTKVEINLAAKETGPSANVSGRVLVDGSSAQGALVSCFAGRRLESRVNARGQYDLGQVGTGHHSLNLSELPGATGHYDFSIRRSIEVVENVPLVEDFEILTGIIAGRVVYEGSRQPVRGVRVTARLEKEKDRSSPYSVRMNTTTGLDGSFRFEGVPVGSYTVDADDREFGCQPHTGLAVFAGGRAGPVTLTMITPITVAGRVVLPEQDRPPRWVGLLFESGEEEYSGSEWVSVNKLSGEFKTKKLIPGSYRVTLYGDFGEGKDRFKKMNIDVPSNGLTDLVLVPEVESPEPEDG